MSSYACVCNTTGLNDLQYKESLIMVRWSFQTLPSQDMVEKKNSLFFILKKVGNVVPPNPEGTMPLEARKQAF